jgi:outer membrane protein OmpU
MSSTPSPCGLQIYRNQFEIITPLQWAKGHLCASYARPTARPGSVQHGARLGSPRRQGFGLALLAAGTAAGLMAFAGRAPAAEVRPGGSLDIQLGGEAAFLAPFGDLKEKLGEQNGRYDFATDMSIELDVTAEDEATGLTYGAYVEFAAETDSLENTEEAWLFVEGGWGELRFGDDDGVTENMALGGFTVATASGGTDGDVIDTPAVNYLTNTDVSTKIVYYSPELAGWQLGLSYSPHGESFGTDIGSTDDGGIDDFFEAGLAYTGSLGEADLLLSLVGAYGRFNDEDDDIDDQVWGVMGGAVVYLGDLSVGAGLATESIGEVDLTWYNVGVAYEVEPVTVSANFGHCFACEQPAALDRDLDTHNLVLGVELAIAPGLATSLEVSFFEESRFDEDDDRFDANDSGILGLGRLAVSF